MSYSKERGEFPRIAITEEYEAIQVGDIVRLHFAGGPHDMPHPWVCIAKEWKDSTVNYRSNPSITVRAANGIERTYDFANIYSPVKE